MDFGLPSDVTEEDAQDDECGTYHDTYLYVSYKCKRWQVPEVGIEGFDYDVESDGHGEDSGENPCGCGEDYTVDERLMQDAAANILVMNKAICEC